MAGPRCSFGLMISPSGYSRGAGGLNALLMPRHIDWYAILLLGSSRDLDTRSRRKNFDLDFFFQCKHAVFDESRQEEHDGI